jgi:outer membrane lipoprotein-sorting protein
MSLFLMTRCKTLYFISWLLLVSAGLALPALAQTSSYNETQLIQRAEQSIREIKTLKANFLQISSDGSVGEGILYFRRPTQLRLEYTKPETLTLVTSRVWLYVDDKVAKSVQAIPLGQTPLSLLLRTEVSFRSEDFKTSAAEHDGIAIRSMVKQDGDAAGQLDLEFDTDSWQLRRWVITDLLGVETIVTLQNPVYGQALANKLFGVPSYSQNADN